jgi:hypothetical protein
VDGLEDELGRTVRVEVVTEDAAELEEAAEDEAAAVSGCWSP